MFNKVSLIFVVVFATTTFTKNLNSNDPLVKNLNNLKGEELNNFVIWQLAQGLRHTIESGIRTPKFDVDAIMKRLNLPEEDTKNFSKLDIPKESKIKLFKWTKDQFNMTTNDVISLLNTRRCPPNTCRRFPDIGELCCPCKWDKWENH